MRVEVRLSPVDKGAARGPLARRQRHLLWGFIPFDTWRVILGFFFMFDFTFEGLQTIKSLVLALEAVCLGKCYRHQAPESRYGAVPPVPLSPPHDTPF